MKKILLSVTMAALSLSAVADTYVGYDQDSPFGFCTRSSRTDASSTYALTGGGCYTYPIPDDFSGKVITLKSNGQDMKSTIQNAIKQNDVVILDGSDGDFIVSSNVGITASSKTIIGINNARLCTSWYITDEIKAALDAAEVLKKSTSSGSGGKLSNGTTISEERELVTRQTIINTTGDNNESYRQSGCLSLSGCQNIIIRNITFVGPGAVDVGGNDLISSNGAKNIWVDHCVFQDGMDGNFDITQQADFHTVSWCIFRYTARSYDHRNTNLVGSSDSETTGYLNTTFAFNWWSTGCNQRMPLARVGKIHMLNNYFSCTGASVCINPRKNSEFLIEGNYFATGVKNYYSQSDATAVTWADNNHVSETANKHSSFGTTVTVPYDYTVAPVADVPTEVQNNAGATLNWGEGGSEQTGTKGSILWPMSSSDSNAEVATTITGSIESTSVTNGSNLLLRTNGTYGNIRFSLFQAQSIQTAAADDNAVTFALTTKSGNKFKASEIELYACKVGTNNGTIDISWKDAGGTQTLYEGVSPNRNNGENNYYSYYNKDISALTTATEGTCALIINIYNVGATDKNTGELQKKDLGLAQVIIKGYIADPSGISTPVTLGTPVATEYYNAAGQRVDAQSRGLVIVKQHLADGSTKSTKVMR